MSDKDVNIVDNSGDISDIQFVDRDIAIKHPGTGKYIGLTVTLCSVDDPSLKSARRKIQDRRMYLSDRGKSFKAEEVEENQFDLLYRAIRGWKWEDNEDGKPGTFRGQRPEFNKVSFAEVTKTLPWIKEILTEEFTNTEDFFNN